MSFDKCVGILNLEFVKLNIEKVTLSVDSRQPLQSKISQGPEVVGSRLNIVVEDVLCIDLYGTDTFHLPLSCRQITPRCEETKPTKRCFKIPKIFSKIKTGLQVRYRDLYRAKNPLHVLTLA